MCSGGTTPTYRGRPGRSRGRIASRCATRARLRQDSARIVPRGARSRLIRSPGAQIGGSGAETRLHCAGAAQTAECGRAGAPVPACARLFRQSRRFGRGATRLRVTRLAKLPNCTHPGARQPSRTPGRRLEHEIRGTGMTASAISAPTRPSVRNLVTCSRVGAICRKCVPTGWWATGNVAQSELGIAQQTPPGFARSGLGCYHPPVIPKVESNRSHVRVGGPSAARA
jgi:hypothetical protein